MAPFLLKPSDKELNVAIKGLEAWVDMEENELKDLPVILEIHVSF